MREANGVGLSANQIGLSWNMFVAEVPDNDGILKLYAIFNPRLEKVARAKKVIFEEGCLSVPKKYGRIERFSEVKLSGLNKLGKPVKIKAWGLLAHVFQHEVDHLNGKLFIDGALEIFDQKSEKNGK
jgi:peptide deformylase